MVSRGAMPLEETAAAVRRVTIRQQPWTEWEQVEPVWRALAEARQDSSIFLSADWAGAWLQTFGAELDPVLSVFTCAGEDVGVCVLSRSRRRILLVPVTRCSLNCTGEACDETPYLEFNTLLCRAGWEETVAEALGDQLATEQWDEFAVDGCSPGLAYEALRRSLQRLDVETEEDWRRSYHIDLAALRRTGTRYEAVLSGNMRGQLRRKAKAFSRNGDLTIRAAGSEEEALEDWEHLAALAKARWTGRGRATPFHSHRFLLFHRTLLRSCFGQGEAQVLRVMAGPVLLGFLYCLVHRRKVYLYQSGMQYAGDSSQSPGMVAIGQAVTHYLEAGMDDFDFLAGEERYKRCLATGARPLVWAVFRRRSVTQRLFGLCREVRSRMWERGGTC
ncbi:MAG: GNAT family N-acetyltransferase [Acidobacteria bacterium]|nr:GNAT family N-acetyltransferase [Acidobacteriota bacterium]